VNVSFGPNKKYSFGVSRTEMKPVHIDDINNNHRKMVVPPGPGKYEPDKSFGTLGHFKTMSSNLPSDKQALERSKKLPGPGYYEP